MAKRLKMMGQPNYANGFRVTLHEHVLEYPLGWKKPKTIFVNSMSDLFHKQVPDSFIIKVFDIMKQAYWHQFQILTKRSTRLKELAPKLDWPQNAWIGVTVENEATKFRIDDLRWVPASIRFLSLEPLLGSLPSLELGNIDWVIVGGESGPRARLIKKEWVIQIKEQCIKQNVPFFFKQWGGINKKKTGRLLEGRTWDKMPMKLNDRQEKVEHNNTLERGQTIACNF
jgi:protein gp37